MKNTNICEIRGKIVIHRRYFGMIVMEPLMTDPSGSCDGEGPDSATILAQDTSDYVPCTGGAGCSEDSSSDTGSSISMSEYIHDNDGDGVNEFHTYAEARDFCLPLKIKRRCKVDDEWGPWVEDTEMLTFPRKPPAGWGIDEDSGAPYRKSTGSDYWRTYYSNVLKLGECGDDCEVRIINNEYGTFWATAVSEASDQQVNATRCGNVSQCIGWNSQYVDTDDMPSGDCAYGMWHSSYDDFWFLYSDRYNGDPYHGEGGIQDAVLDNIHGNVVAGRVGIENAWPEGRRGSCYRAPAQFGGSVGGGGASHRPMGAGHVKFVLQTDVCDCDNPDPDDDDLTYVPIIPYPGENVWPVPLNDGYTVPSGGLPEGQVVYFVTGDPDEVSHPDDCGRITYWVVETAIPAGVIIPEPTANGQTWDTIDELVDLCVQTTAQAASLGLPCNTIRRCLHPLEYDGCRYDPGTCVRLPGLPGEWTLVDYRVCATTIAESSKKELILEGADNMVAIEGCYWSVRLKEDVDGAVDPENDNECVASWGHRRFSYAGLGCSMRDANGDLEPWCSNGEGQVFIPTDSDGLSYSVELVGPFDTHFAAGSLNPYSDWVGLMEMMLNNGSTTDVPLYGATLPYLPSWAAVKWAEYESGTITFAEFKTFWNDFTTAHPGAERGSNAVFKGSCTEDACEESTESGSDVPGMDGWKWIKSDGVWDVTYNGASAAGQTVYYAAETLTANGWVMSQKSGTIQSFGFEKGASSDADRTYGPTNFLVNGDEWVSLDIWDFQDTEVFHPWSFGASWLDDWDPPMASPTGAETDEHPTRVDCDSGLWDHGDCESATHGIFTLNCDAGSLEAGVVAIEELSRIVGIGEIYQNSLITAGGQPDNDLWECPASCTVMGDPVGSPPEPPIPTPVGEDEDEDPVCVDQPCPPGWVWDGSCCYELNDGDCTPGVDCAEEELIDPPVDPPDPPDPGTPPPIECDGTTAVPEDAFTVTGTGGASVATLGCLEFTAQHHTCVYLDYLAFSECDAIIVTIENLSNFPQYREGAWILVQNVAEIVTGVYPIKDVTDHSFTIAARRNGRTPLSGEPIQPGIGNSANSFHVMDFTSNVLTNGEFMETSGAFAGWTVDNTVSLDHLDMADGKFATGGWGNSGTIPPDYDPIIAQQDVYLDQTKTYEIQFVGDATVYANTDISGTLSDDSAFTLASGASWSSNVGTIDGTPVTMADDEWPLITVPVSGTYTIYVRSYSDAPSSPSPYAYYLDRIHISEC